MIPPVHPSSPERRLQAAAPPPHHATPKVLVPALTLFPGLKGQRKLASYEVARALP